MPTLPPLILLPPSKGKAPGGDAPSYGDTLDDGHPLASPRREVLDAVREAASDLDDGALRRVAGVAARDVDAARDTFDRLADALTLPAHRRYTGVVHGNAGLPDRDPCETSAEVRIVSPLLGLVALDEPVPAYRLELSGRLPSFGGLGPFWREALASHLAAVGEGRRVWDLLPGEHRRVWDGEVHRRLEVIDVRFERPDGRAANAARTKVAKGRLTAALLAEPSIDPRDPGALAEVADLDDGWRLGRDADGIVATFHG